MFFFGIYELVLQVGEVVLDLPAHRLDHSRHRDQYRSALAPDCGDDLVRLQTVLENHGAADQRGNEHSQKLSKDVAERQHVDEANGMEDALVFAVLGNLTLNRVHARQQVPVRKHHSTRFGGGP